MKKIFFFFIIGSVVIGLVGCSANTSILMKEYKGTVLTSHTMGVFIDPPQIINTDDVADDLGAGVADEVYMDYFKSIFPKYIMKFGRVDTVVFFHGVNTQGLLPRELELTGKENLRIFLPADSVCVGSDSVDPDYVLFISKYYISRIRASAGNYLPGFGAFPGMYNGGSAGKLSHYFQYAIWDNQKGRLVSYGRIEETSELVLYTMTKSNWTACIENSAMAVMKASPFSIWKKLR